MVTFKVLLASLLLAGCAPKVKRQAVDYSKEATISFWEGVALGQRLCRCDDKPSAR